MFEKGNKHSKGRQLGSKNRRTNLFGLCDELGINVFKEMLDAAAKELDPDKRFNKFRDLAPYLYAKPRDVEINLTAEQLLDMAEEQLSESSATPESA